MSTKIGLLQGSGEPLHQLRRLIQELSFGNAQARERGELDLAKRRLELLEFQLDFAQRHGLITDAQAAEVCYAVLCGASPTHCLPELLQLTAGDKQ